MLRNHRLHHRCCKRYHDLQYPRSSLTKTKTAATTTSYYYCTSPSPSRFFSSTVSPCDLHPSAYISTSFPTVFHRTFVCSRTAKTTHSSSFCAAVSSSSLSRRAFSSPPPFSSVSSAPSFSASTVVDEELSPDSEDFLSSLHSYRRTFDRVVITDSLERVVNSSVKVTLSGAALIHTILVNKGVEFVFGYSGGAVLPLIDQFVDSPIRFYASSHEQCVGHAAAAVGKSTGRPGIVVVTSGPGLTNLITPLQDAFMDGVPMIVISGQVPISVMGTDAFQECPATALTKPCTKWNFLAQDVASLPWAVENAFRIAMSGRKGPVHIDCPKNVLVSCAPIPLSYVQAGHRPGSRDMGATASARENSKLLPATDTIDEVADMINRSKRPVLCVGHGACDAYEDVRELAIKARIPVTTTVHGLGVFDEYQPLSCHMLGMHGSAYANYAVQSADLLVSIGSRFDDRTTGVLSRYAPEAKKAAAAGSGGIVHFEIDRRQIGKTVQPTKSVLGDCRVSLEHLLPNVHDLVRDFPEASTRLEWLRTVEGWKDKFPFRWQAAPHGQLKIQDVVSAINKAVNVEPESRLSKQGGGGRWLQNASPSVFGGEEECGVVHGGRRTFFTTGVGNHQMMCAQFIRWRFPRQMITSGGLGVMGAGLPFAVGVQIANPNDRVILIDGDGSFNMTCTDLQSVSEYKLPIKIAIMNDGSLQMVRVWQQLFFEKRFKAVTTHSPDYIKLADAYGIPALRCSTQQELLPTIRKWLDCEGPMLVDFRVKSDICLPMVQPGKALDEMLFSIAEIEAANMDGPAPS
eukprot:GHVS01048066.1.p1 GENE.GHVS01048066.1~~GHVS01048066.1.p1  ORF type:complete len:800 (+),score=139.77 GHVS01048066.1:112-2511(+)